MDRAVAETAHSVGEWHGNAAKAAWGRMTRAERAEMSEYWAAFRENEEWGWAVHSSWERKLVWSVENAAWRGETDEEYAARTAELKWRPGPNGFEYIGSVETRRAA